MWFGFETSTVDIIRPGSKVVRGDTLPDWDTATEHSEPGWIVQPLAAAEQLGLRDANITSLRALAPAPADVTPLDRVRYAGTVYEVDGKPQPYPTPPGMLQHNEIVLKLVEG